MNATAGSGEKIHEGRWTTVAMSEVREDETGYIIPKSEWDRKPPYLYGAKRGGYGEINSVGPDAAGKIHAALSGLCRTAGGDQPAKNRFRNADGERVGTGARR